MFLLNMVLNNMHWHLQWAWFYVSPAASIRSAVCYKFQRMLSSMGVAD